MWKYTLQDAYHAVSLHDCRADRIRLVGNDLLFDFPEGFWILPNSGLIQHDRPLKTGPAQLCFHGVWETDPFDSIDIFKTTYLFRKALLCRRIQPAYTDFLQRFQSGKYELEFITEYHGYMSNLYQCWIWKKNSGMDAECQLDIMAKSVEYRWNEIRPDHEW